MKATGVSPGVGIARAICYAVKAIVVPDGKVSDAKAEKTRFLDVLQAVVANTQELADRARESMGDKDAEILEAHCMMLEDPEVVEPIETLIDSDSLNAAKAIEQVMDSHIATFEAMEDEYFSARAADLKDIRDRLLRKALGIELMDISNLSEPVVLVAHDLTPSDTARMDAKHIAGILTETGGRTSHSAITARTLEIPAIVGAASVLTLIEDGDLVCINGATGEFAVNPDASERERFESLKRAYAAEKGTLEAFRGQKTVSNDGVVVELAGNITAPKDCERVIAGDGEGVGLFRTEFLYMDRDDIPTEDEQFEAYKAAAQAMDGKAVVIRTLDIGGDKELPALGLKAEVNPFLGYRAIRFCLDRPELFKAQLRAILRASAYGKLRIMFPMISALSELRKAKELTHEAMEELRLAGASFDEDIQIGIMVEVPSTAVMADAFAKECDFFSIGTNDLTQYTLAVDRGNDCVAHLYSSFHPAVLRLINDTIQAGKRAGIWVGMCGEAAGDPLMIPLLLGMGLDEFSMNPGSILKARAIISRLSAIEMRVVACEAMDMATSAEVLARCKTL